MRREALPVRRARPLGILVAVVVLVAAGLGACSQENDQDPRPGVAPRTTRLVWGVFGSRAEIASYQAVVDAYNDRATTIEVELESWPTSEAMIEAITPTSPGGAPAQDPPDLYLLSRDELAEVRAAELNVPLFDLLAARSISYGDGFPRSALSAFSRESDLQCLPYSVSPMVMYLNTDLVPFEEMRAKGLDAPEPDLEKWTLEQFRVAGRYATRGQRGTRGISIEPTLRSLAPYLYSGGGRLYDSDTDPRSLDLSSDANRSTLAQVLDVARNTRTTLTDEQLAEATPTEWFERGRLGMVAGFRSLTPELRGIADLHFDVMPMPEVDHGATVGDLTGLCIAPGRTIQKAADFMVYAVSAEGYAPVARAGYVVPANLAVARSADFLQPDQQPANAAAFNAGVDELVLPPVIEEEQALDRAVDPLLADAFTIPLIPDVDEVTTAIDEASRAVLDPPEDPTQSDSPSG